MDDHPAPPGADRTPPTGRLAVARPVGGRTGDMAVPIIALDIRCAPVVVIRASFGPIHDHHRTPNDQARPPND
jgi:hypothetical protein